MSVADPMRFVLVTLAIVASSGCKKDSAADNGAQHSAASNLNTAGVKPGAQGLDSASSMQISETDRCPVCAMGVSKHRQFASAIELQDGTTFYFCGTGCMLKSWLHPEIFLSHERTDLKRAVTREYFGGKHIDASQAYWVAGSDVVGPMGPAIVPLASEADLGTFKKRHGGTTTFRLDELTDAKFKQLTGKDPSAGHKAHQ